MPRGYPGTKSPHGTASRYSNHGCRCSQCREAWRIYRRDYSHRTRRSMPLDEWKAHVRAEAEARDNHGTESRYVNLGCRCDECKEASRVERARRRASQLVEGTGLR